MVYWSKKRNLQKPSIFLFGWLPQLLLLPCDCQAWPWSFDRWVSSTQPWPTAVRCEPAASGYRKWWQWMMMIVALLHLQIASQAISWKVFLPLSNGEAVHGGRTLLLPMAAIETWLWVVAIGDNGDALPSSIVVLHIRFQHVFTPYLMLSFNHKDPMVSTTRLYVLLLEKMSRTNPDLGMFGPWLRDFKLQNLQRFWLCLSPRK